MCVCTMGQQALDTVDFVILYRVMEGCIVLYQRNMFAEVSYTPVSLNIR